MQIRGISTCIPSASSASLGLPDSRVMGREQSWTLLKELPKIRGAITSVTFWLVKNTKLLRNVLHNCAQCFEWLSEGETSAWKLNHKTTAKKAFLYAMRSDMSSLCPFFCLFFSIINSYCKKSINLKYWIRSSWIIRQHQCFPLLSSVSSGSMQRRPLCGSKGGMGNSTCAGRRCACTPFYLSLSSV